MWKFDYWDGGNSSYFIYFTSMIRGGGGGVGGQDFRDAYMGHGQKAVKAPHMYSVHSLSI